MRRLFSFSISLVLSLSTSLFAQGTKKPITLDDLYTKPAFAMATGGSLAFTADDQHVTDLVANSLIKRSVEEPIRVDTLIAARELGSLSIDSYVLSEDERRVLIRTQTRPIYRHSFTAVCYVFDLAKRSLIPVFERKGIQNAALNADASRIAFVFENNLYVQELNGTNTVQVTTTGTKNKLIHGATDWVYEEEFGYAEGFVWSPDGARIAYLSFDESAVPQYGMDMYGSLYPKRVEFKYPKAGEANSIVSLHVYEVGSGAHTRIDVGAEKDQYITNLQWTEDPYRVAFLRLSRLQNKVELLTATAQTGESRVVLSEQSDTYLEVGDETVRFVGSNELLWLSDRSGWQHYYRYDLAGKLLGQVTAGEADVRSLLAVDVKAKTLYYLASESDPRESHVFSVGLSGKNRRRLTELGQSHSATFSPKASFWLHRASAPEVPMTVTLRRADGKVVRVLEDNAKLRSTLAEYQRAVPVHYQFTTDQGIVLYGYQLRPADFDSTKKYPLLMFVYGGPHSQNVSRAYSATSNGWFHYLVGQGYIIACVDNRGTDWRGRDFKKVHYKQLGKVETEDQMASARYLAGLPYIDGSRIGIYGHSYGGYMTLMSLLQGGSLFKCGISAAPVTSWRYYDTIYTERYMSTPQLNPEGYDRGAPLTLAGQLSSKLLIMHGTADDNVHLQNTLDMVDALTKANKPFDMALYPNRNHGIGGGNVTRHRFTMMTQWLRRNL